MPGSRSRRGFVVGAPAYAAFVDETDLRERLAALLGDLDVDDAADARRGAPCRRRRWCAAQDLPGWIAKAIAKAYDAGVRGRRRAPVAVRSSATAEDTEAASFAGMNETFLNIKGSDAVADAVRRCWASLFGARTIFYRAKRGFSQTDIDIAVVVQRQIQSTRSGVMFTIDPASGRTRPARDRGLLRPRRSRRVGQRVTRTATWSTSRRSTIMARDVKGKELVIESKPGGGTVTRLLEGDEGRAPTLTDDEVGELAELGRRIEQHYGAPQDTEWAFDPDGKAWMLQSRPVTSAGGESSTDGQVHRAPS